MKKPLSIIILVMLSFSINAQAVLGKWNNRDEKTGEIDSVVEIYKKNGKLFAKIIDIMNPELKNALCTKCKGSLKNKPALGLHVLYKLEKKKNKWVGGYGLDPRTGFYFNVYIKLVNSNKLKIRGYAGIPIFGKTVYWDKVKTI
jgi:uncharacterized protein (DUF2147 family)